MTDTISFADDDAVYPASVGEGGSNGAPDVRSVECAILPNALNEAIAASPIT